MWISLGSYVLEAILVLYLGFTLRVLCVWSYTNSSSSCKHKAPRVLDTFQIFLTGTNNREISHLSVGRIVRIGSAYILL